MTRDYGKRLKIGVATAGATIVAAGLLASTASAQGRSDGGRSPVAGTQPPWASSGHRAAGQPSGEVTARVYLSSKDPAGLASYARAVSTPGNRDYRHYLSAAQARARFGPAGYAAGAVRGWLRHAGMTVTSAGTAGFGSYVQARGSLASARVAFGTSFANYHGPDGRVDRAPTGTATVPSSLAADVASITGLDTARHDMKPADTLPPPGPNFWPAGPCSSYYGQKMATGVPLAYGKTWPWEVCGYHPSQLRSAYGVTRSGMTGVGQTVAIVDAYASPTMESDASTYAKVVGDKPFRPGQYQQVLASSWEYTAPDECDAAGWYGEESLDVETVHGLAPNANVRYVGAASCTDQDLFAAEAMIVNKHLASVVSDSWGEPWEYATMTRTENQLFQAGAAEGIGFYFSSGDSGSDGPLTDPSSHELQADWPASSPWVTSVGGTSLAIGKTGDYEWETSWGTLSDPIAAGGTAWSLPAPGTFPASWDGGAGGGTSSQFTQPWYQRGVVPAKMALTLPGGAIATQPMRTVPDVAAVADPSTGILLGETGLQPDGTTEAFSLSRIGGTSLACPLFAAIEADAQQAAGHVFGFANPAIYRRAGTSAFHDVTDHPLGAGHLAEIRNDYTNPFTKQGPLVTKLRTLGIDGEGAAALPAVTGYDESTGVGTPRDYIQSFRR